MSLISFLHFGQMMVGSAMGLGFRLEGAVKDGEAKGHKKLSFRLPVAVGFLRHADLGGYLILLAANDNENCGPGSLPQPARRVKETRITGLGISPWRGGQEQPSWS